MTENIGWIIGIIFAFGIGWINGMYWERSPTNKKAGGKG